MIRTEDTRPQEKVARRLLVVLLVVLALWAHLGPSVAAGAAAAASSLTALGFMLVQDRQRSRSRAGAADSAVDGLETVAVTTLEGFLPGQDTLPDQPPFADRLLNAQSAIYLALREMRKGAPEYRAFLNDREGQPHLLAARRLPDGRHLLWTLDPLRAFKPGPQTLYRDLPFLRLEVNGDGEIQGLNPAARDLGLIAGPLEQQIGNGPFGVGTIHPVLERPGLRLRCASAQTGASGYSEIFLFPVSSDDVEADSFESQLDRLPIALLHCSREGAIVHVNEAARVLLGEISQSARRVQDLLDTSGRPVLERLTKMMEGERFNADIFRVIGPDMGRFVQVSGQSVVVDGRDEILLALSDATDLKTLEAQFVQSQKMQAVGQLAGGIAHDFNNLLTAISGHCDLLLMRHEAPDRSHADLMQIRQNVNRAAALVRQLLAFSRKQTLQPRRLILADVLSDLSHLLDRLIGAKVSLVMDYADTLPMVRVDKRQLEQVVMNLVVNARDAMDNGGTVFVRARFEAFETATRRGRVDITQGDYVRIDVSDTGVGIEPALLDKIFEPFFTTKVQGKGTGLGLSTVYGIVKQSGGYVFVDSRLGEGTTFSVFLPAQPDGAPEAKAAPTPAIARDVTGRGVVLLAEDEDPVRAFVVRALTMRGYTVREAASGEDALALLEQEPDLRPDLILSDVVMPGRDGPTWVGEARKSLPHVPVIFMSGYAEDAFVEDGRVGEAGFLAKPFSLNDLTLLVRETLDGHQPRNPS